MGNASDEQPWSGPVSNTAHATDKDQFAIKVRSTIEFNFGRICDLVRETLTKAGVDAKTIKDTESQCRGFGNGAIRVVEAHLALYNVIRRHETDTLNKSRVLKKAKEANVD